MHIWLAVTADKYELPVMIADSVNELSERLGISKSVIMKAKADGRASRKYKLRFERVRIDDVSNCGD